MTRRFARIVMALLVVVGALIAGQVRAQQPVTISVSIKNHRFQPAELHAPANVPIELRVKNLELYADGIRKREFAGGEGRDAQQRGHYPAAAFGAGQL